MKPGSILNMVVFNVVGIVLAYLVYGDRVYRIDYWNSLGFVSSTQYYPLFYATSAVKGSTSIQGLLTVDWLQVIIVVLVVVDAVFVLGYRRGARGIESPGKAEGE